MLSFFIRNNLSLSQFWFSSLSSVGASLCKKEGPYGGGTDLFLFFYKTVLLKVDYFTSPSRFELGQP
jgi:hypothetical protein